MQKENCWKHVSVPTVVFMEWAQEFPEAEPGHRHISHLFAVHPGSQINLLQTPELAEAASKSMDYRISHGGGYTGWSQPG